MWHRSLSRTFADFSLYGISVQLISLLCSDGFCEDIQLTKYELQPSKDVF